MQQDGSFRLVDYNLHAPFTATVILLLAVVATKILILKKSVRIRNYLEDKIEEWRFLFSAQEIIGDKFVNASLLDIRGIRKQSLIDVSVRRTEHRSHSDTLGTK